MQIVTDSGADLNLTPEQRQELHVHVVPLTVTLDGKTYREGLDIRPAEFYPLLEASPNLPTTSQPSVGEFVLLYQQLARTDVDILSIHISSGLSGTYNAARTAAEMVPEARVTHVDTKTLAAAAGWQVEAAARALRARWPLERILALLGRLQTASESLYTLAELKYLIHGGRISHMKGLLANLFNIKPLIGVENARGTYVQLGQARTFGKALVSLVDVMLRRHPAGSALQVQVLHAFNPEAAEELRGLIGQKFQCTWLPVGPMSLVLGAHTGRSMVGVAFVPRAVYAEIP
jgi:DegV family protein with EDD domain